MYVRDYLSSRILVSPEDTPVGAEAVWVSIQSRILPSLIEGCIYRHPRASSDSFQYLADPLRHMNLRGRPLYVLGDLNDNLLAANSKLLKIIDSCKLHQQIKTPTRITAQSSTLLDVIRASNLDSVVSSDTLPAPIADHDMVTVTINISKPKLLEQEKTFLCMVNYSKEKFCEILYRNSSILDCIRSTDDVDLQVEIFNSVFISCLDMVAPITTRAMTRPPAPWICNTLIEFMKIRDNLRSLLKSDRGNITLYIQY